MLECADAGRPWKELLLMRATNPLMALPGSTGPVDRHPNSRTDLQTGR